MAKSRKVYPTDVSDEEWEFVAPYLTLMREDVPQRRHAWRDLFDAMRKDGQSDLSVAAPAGRLSALDGGRAAEQTLDQSGLF